MVAFWVVAGCASAAPESSVPSSGSGLMGLSETRPTDWWRARAPVEVGERPSLDGWVVFDARTVVEPTSRELVWQSLNAVLSGFTQDASVMAQAELEPGDTSTWDAYFLVHGGQAREGVLWRLGGAEAGVTLQVLLQRGEGAVDEIAMWIVPQREGIAPLSARWSQTGTACLSGVVSEVSDVASLASSSGCVMEFSVLTGALFERVSHAGYLSDPDASRPPTRLPEDLPYRDRTLDEVFSGSVFPPRMTLELPGPAGSP